MFLDEYFRMIDLQKRIKREGKKRKPAYMIGENKCVNCGFCCFRRTCVPTPHETKKIAEFLEMDVEKMIGKYMVGDRIANSNTFLRWANTGQKNIVGTFMSAERTFDTGDCIMWDKEKKTCKIESVKPREAREFECWAKKANQWSGKDAWKSGDVDKLAPNLDINEHFDFDYLSAGG